MVSKGKAKDYFILSNVEENFKYFNTDCVNKRLRAVFFPLFLALTAATERNASRISTFHAIFNNEF